MANQFVEVDGTPTDITSRFTVGQIYLGNNGGSDLRYVWVDDTDPDPTEGTGNYVLVTPGGGFPILPRSGEKLFVWTPAPSGGTFTYDLVP